MSRLFKKTLLIMIFLFGVVAAASSLVAAWLIHSHLTAEYKSKAVAIARGIAAFSPEIFLNLDAATVQSIIDQFTEIQGVAYVMVETAQGEVLAHTFVPSIPSQVRMLDADRPGPGRRPLAGGEYQVQEVGDWLDVSYPILNGLAGRVHVGMDLKRVRRAIWSAIVKVQIITFGIFLSSVLVAYLLMNQVSQPLALLTEYASKLAARDFSAPLDIKAKGEIGLLAQTMTSMARELESHLQSIQGAMDALRRSEKRYRDLFNSISDLIYTHDLQGRIISANRAVAQVFGYPLEEIIGRPITDFMEPEQGRRFREHYIPRILAQGSQDGIQVYLSRRGEKIYLEYRNILVKNPGQEPFVSGSGRDVTQRVRAERALRESEEHLRSLVESSQDAIMSLDSRHRVTSCNTSFLSQFAYQRDEIVGRSESLIHPSPASYQEFSAAVYPVLHQRGYWRGEWSFARKDGREIPMEVVESVQRRSDGTTLGYVAILRDLSERKKAEQEARLNRERMFQAAKMVSLGTVVSGVAHEINNPISFVMLNAPALRRIWEGLLPVLEEYRREHGEFEAQGMDFEELKSEVPLLLDYITDGARRVKNIVSDLKSYARQTPAQMDQEVHLNRVVESAYTLTRNLVSKATDHFSLSLAPGLPFFRGNVQRIEQVVVNLIINACEALPERRRAIEVVTRHRPRAQEVVLEVRDEGVGMSPETLSRVTDPFFTTKRDEGGTGLGISVSAGIVEVHGGSMSFMPNSRGGITVRVAFPLNSGAGAGEPAPAESESLS